MEGINVSIYVNKELLEKTKIIVKDLGYRSFSEFVSDLMSQAVIAYDVSVKLKKMSAPQAKESVLKSIIAKIISESK